MGEIILKRLYYLISITFLFLLFTGIVSASEISVNESTTLTVVDDSGSLLTTTDLSYELRDDGNSSGEDDWLYNLENISDNTIENSSVFMDDIQEHNTEEYCQFINYLINDCGFEFRNESLQEEGYLIYATQNYTGKLYDGINFTILPNETYFISITQKEGCFIYDQYYPDIIYSVDDNYYLDEEYLSWLIENNPQNNTTIPPEYLNNNPLTYNNYISETEREKNQTRSDSPLPSRYDSRDYGYVTNVKNQDQYGITSNCWAFATVSALETYLLKFENKLYNISTDWDLSENHLKNVMSSRGRNGTDLNSGGTIYMSLAYLLRWSGPINETEDSYGSSNYSIENLNPLKHVQGIQLLHQRTGSLDIMEIKRAIYEYGSVVTSLYWDKSYEREQYSTYMYPCNITPIYYENWHEVTIVGWDDNFPASEFFCVSEGNGAFIVKNSYGNNSGDNGFWYVSYYDTSLGYRPSLGFVGFAITNIENITNYDNNYHYNPLGINSWKSTIVNSLTFANQWTSCNNETLKACGLYVLKPCECHIRVLIDDVQVGSTTFYHCNYSGYYTINFDESVNVTEGQTYKIAVTLTNDDLSNIFFPVEEKKGYYSKVNASANQSFIWDNQWVDYININSDANICLNVYTVSNVGHVNSSLVVNDLIMVYGDGSSLVAYLKDDNGNALVNKTIVFKINGRTFTRLSDNSGRVSLFIGLNPHVYTTVVSFNGDEIYRESSKMVVVKVNKINARLSVTQTGTYYKTKKLTVKLVKSSNNESLAGVVISIKFNANRIVKLTTNVNGIAYYNVPLQAGHYNVVVSVNNNAINARPVSFTMNILKANPSTFTVNNFVTNYKSGKYLSIKVSIGSTPMIGVNLKLKVYLNSNTYKILNLKTDSNGIAKCYCSGLSIGTHNVIALTGESTNNMVITSKSVTVRINQAPTTVTASNVVHKHGANKYFTATIRHQDTNNLISNIKVNVKIYTTGSNYVTYTLTTNANGMIYYNTKNLSVGTHSIILTSGSGLYTLSCTRTITITT